MFIKYGKDYQEKYKELFEGDKITIAAIGAYYNDRLIELQKMACRGDAWFFGSCCTFIEVLAWGAYFDKICGSKNGMSGGEEFKNFIDEYFILANPKYKELKEKLETTCDKKRLVVKSLVLWRKGFIRLCVVE